MQDKRRIENERETIDEKKSQQNYHVQFIFALFLAGLKKKNKKQQFNFLKSWAVNFRAFSLVSILKSIRLPFKLLWATTASFHQQLKKKKSQYPVQVNLMSLLQNVIQSRRREFFFLKKLRFIRSDLNFKIVSEGLQLLLSLVISTRAVIGLNKHIFFLFAKSERTMNERTNKHSWRTQIKPFKRAFFAVLYFLVFVRVWTRKPNLFSD